MRGEHVHQPLLLPLQPLDLRLQVLVLSLQGVALLLIDFQGYLGLISG